MRMTTLFCILALSIGGVHATAWADTLYRCADGSYTNKAERQCRAYESKGIVRVQGSGETSKSPVADVKLSDERTSSKAPGR